MVLTNRQKKNKQAQRIGSGRPTASQNERLLMSENHKMKKQLDELTRAASTLYHNESTNGDTKKILEEAARIYRTQPPAPQVNTKTSPNRRWRLRQKGQPQGHGQGLSP